MKIILTERDEALFVNYVMLTRQLTKLSDCIFHIARLATNKRHGSMHLDYRGYRAYAQSELADAICQLKKMCDTLDLDFGETMRLGVERDIEKKKEYLDVHPQDYWV